jgi:hypothetical protein
MIRVILFFLIAHGVSAEELTFRSPETRTHLIELFTSEGCSSCPPAEDWFNQLQKHSKLWRDFVPVAYHVDYWDRLGWRDPFASSENTERQKKYAEEWGAKTYTPCFVINGKEWMTQRSGKLDPSTEKKGVLEVRIRGEEARINFQPRTEQPKPFKAWIALLTGEVTTNVQAGENSGRRLTHTFVSLGTRQAEMKFIESRWISDISFQKIKGTSALAIWVTSGDSLEPEQATGGWIIDPQKHGK